MNLLLPWTLEVHTSQGTEEELRKGPGQGEREMRRLRSLPSGAQQWSEERNLKPGRGDMSQSHAHWVLLRGSMQDESKCLFPQATVQPAGGPCVGLGIGQADFSCPQALQTHPCPLFCSGVLPSFPLEFSKVLGNEMPTQAAHSKVEELEWTMSDCSKLSSVPLEALYGPSLGKHGPH